MTIVLRRCGAAFLLLVPGLGAQSPVPVLLTDINTVNVGTVNLGSEPVLSRRPGPTGATMFSAWTETTGRELWVTYGTPASTQLVQDFSPGLQSSDPQQITPLDNRIFLIHMSAPAEGPELFRFEFGSGFTLLSGGNGPLGASAMALKADPTGSFALGIRVDKGPQYDEYVKLFSTDGQTVDEFVSFGPVPLGTNREIVARHAANLFEFDAAGNRASLFLDDGVHGEEVLEYDSVLGTFHVIDVFPGSAGSGPLDAEYAGGRLFASARWPGAGRELVVSDNTNLALVADLNPFGDSDPLELTAYINNTVYFTADDGSTGRELWMVDSNLQPLQVADILPGAPGSDPRGLSVSGPRLFFNADDGTGNRRMWIVDNGAAPMQLPEIQPGSPSSRISAIAFDDASGTIYLVVTINDDSQLWNSTDLGITWTPLTNSRAGQGGADPRQLIWNGQANRLLFVGSDDTVVDELFAYDPATNQVQLLADVNGPTPQTASSGAGVSGFTYLNGKTYFRADNGIAGNELWASDGTAQGTQQVADLNPGLTASQIEFTTPLTETEFVMAANRVGVTGKELYKFDTVSQTLSLVKDIKPGSGSSDPRDFFGPRTGIFLSVSPYVFFTADDGVNGAEPWASAGTAATTLMLDDIRPGPIGSFARHYHTVRGELVFSANDGTHGEELFAYVGGTVTLLRDINPGPVRGTYLQHAAELNGWLYFGGHAPNETGLWRTDGLFAQSVVTLQPGSLAGLATEITAFQGRVYFGMNDGLSGMELWANDGTIGNAILVADINPGGPSSTPRKLTVAGDRLFFLAAEGISTFLYSFDGETLTKLDIGVGSTNPEPPQLVPYGDVIYFEAGSTTSPTGREVWVSDGTGAGTRQLTDIRRGPGGAGIRDISIAGGRVWVSADDGVHGVEPFLVESTLPGVETFGTPCGPDQATLSADSPTLGGDLSFSGTAPPSAVGVLVIGDMPTGIPLLLFGCNVLVDPTNAFIAHVFATGPGGTWAFSTPLPATGTLANVVMAGWTLFLPIAPTEPVQGSNGVLFRLGV